MARPMTAILLCLGCALLASRAHAGGSDEARGHTEQARSYYNELRYAEALAEFEEAHRLSRLAPLLYNIAVCQERLGHVVDAAATFERYLRESPNLTDRKEVLDHLQALTRRGQPTAASAKSNARRRADVIWGVAAGLTAVAVGGLVLGLTLKSGANDQRLAPESFRP